MHDGVEEARLDVFIGLLEGTVTALVSVEAVKTEGVQTGQDARVLQLLATQATPCQCPHRLHFEVEHRKVQEVHHLCRGLSGGCYGVL